MPSVGKRKEPRIGDMRHNPMYEYASRFCDVQKNILTESTVDYAFEPQRALALQGNIDALREFFIEESYVPWRDKTGNQVRLEAEAEQDHLETMNELFINDVQAVQENAVAGLSNFNPMIGLSLPMHKYLMLNCVFAQALPRFVAKSPMWTESIETRYMISPTGEKIDIANQQNQIYRLWKSANPPKEVILTLPEIHQKNILADEFGVTGNGHNLSVATHINGIIVRDFAKKGDDIFTVDSTTGKLKPGKATEDGVAFVCKPWKATFTPGYGEAKRIIVQPINMLVTTDGTEATQTELQDMIFASQTENLFDINSTSGQVVGVRMWCRYDASTRTRKTPRVEWGEKTLFVQIPERDGMTVPVTPEEVKDVGNLYGINQVTKYMSMIRDVFENVKDDEIKEFLDDSFERLDDDHKLARTVDFAPRRGYHSDHIEWLQKTFMNSLDRFITGLLTVLRDPNMTINILARPDIIRSITPIEYTYQSSNQAGPIELDFRKTVVTSDKRTYNFISSEKLFGNDNMIILLIPKNTNRIVYRIYDYQMYLSNEIRDSEMPHLPALTAFERWIPYELFPVQGRLHVANPSGLREHLTADDYIGRREDGELYANNALGDVYKHWDEEEHRNVTAEYQRARDAAKASQSSSTTDPTDPSKP